MLAAQATGMSQIHESLPNDFLARHPWIADALARYLAQPLKPRGRAPIRDAKSLSSTLVRGDVLLTQGITRLAALVRLLTGSAWSHVALYVGPLEDGPNPRCVVEADISEGVRAVPLSEFDGMRVRALRPVFLHEAERNGLADWVIDRIGDPYDLAHALAMARILLGLKTPRRLRPGSSATEYGVRRFVCTSLLAQAFMMVGHPIPPTQLGFGQLSAPDHLNVTPSDFERAPVFEVVNRD